MADEEITDPEAIDYLNRTYAQAGGEQEAPEPSDDLERAVREDTVDREITDPEAIAYLDRVFGEKFGGKPRSRFLRKQQVDEEQPQTPETTAEAPQAESTIGSAARAGVHAILPTLGGAATGALAGAAAGGGLLSIPAAIIGAIGGGYLASSAQEKALRALGFDDEAQQAANVKEHPYATLAGELAAAAPVFGVGGAGSLTKAALGGRAVAGGVMGGIEYAQSDDPTKAALAAAGGAALAGTPTAIGRAVMAPSEKIGNRLARALLERGTTKANPTAAIDPATGATAEGASTAQENPAATVDAAQVQTPGTDRPGPESARGKSEESIPPNQENTTDEIGGFKQEGDQGNTGKFQKRVRPTEGETASGVNVNADGIAPDVKSVLTAEKPPAPRPAPAQPPEQAASPQGQPAPVQPAPQPRQNDIWFSNTPVEESTSIPYTAGSSRSGDKVYVDPRAAAPMTLSTGRNIDPTGALRVHELYERAAMEARFNDIAEGRWKPNAKDIDGINKEVYDAAHKEVANPMEQRYLREALGLNDQEMADYNRQMKERIATTEKGPATPGENAPADLYTAMYPVRGIHEYGGGFKGQDEIPGAGPEVVPTEAQQAAVAPNAGTPKAARMLAEARARREARAAQEQPVQQAQQEQPPLTPRQKFTNLQRQEAARAQGERETLRRGRGGAPPPPEGPPPGGEPPAGEGGKPRKSRLAEAAPQQSAPDSFFTSLRRHLAPVGLSEASQSMAARIRKVYGGAEQESQQAKASLEEAHKLVNPLSPEDQRALVDKMEGGNDPRYRDWQVPEQVKPVMTAIKGVADRWKAALEDLDDEERMTFITNFLPHIYAQPEEAGRVLSEISAGKRGSSGSTQKRSIPTYAEAEARGLVPKYQSPVDMISAYNDAISMYVAHKRLIRGLRNDGLLVYGAPKVVGATGGPRQVTNIDPTWAPLHGVETPYGQQAYVPRDAATIYNNFMDAGFRKDPSSRNIYDAARRTSNAVTALELGFNGYHLFTVGTEAYLSDLSKALGQAAAGQFKEAGKSVLKSPAAPVTKYQSGIRGLRAYQNMPQKQTVLQKMRGEAATPTTPEEIEIAKLAAESGMRPVGRGYSPDVEFSKHQSLWNSYVRKSLPKEMEAMWKKVTDDPLRNTHKAAFDMFGRILQTTSQPLFEHYIPALKYGVWADNMAAFIKAKPNSTYEERLAYGRKMSDSVDNRLGEMIQDNLFMRAATRQAGLVGLRSFSWTLGTFRELGGGATSAARSLGKGDVRGFKNKLDITHPSYDPRLAYSLAFPFGIAMMGAMYQYMRTGEAPSEVKDFYYPMTGGLSPGVGGRGVQPERAVLPGYQKDVVGWTTDPVREAYNKQATAWSTLEEVLTGKDTFGRPIVHPDADLVQNLIDRAQYVYGKMGPISIKNMVTGQKTDSAITPVETALGLRAAGKGITDPEGLARAKGAIGKREWKIKQRQEERAKKERGG